MATRAHRVKLLCAIARRLQTCGPMYLATLLVSEAYERECLVGTAFDQGDRDAALVRLLARLEPLVAVAPAPLPIAREKRVKKARASRRRALTEEVRV